MPRVYFKTYGCQMNERDSEAVGAQLVAEGYRELGTRYGLKMLSILGYKTDAAR